MNDIVIRESTSSMQMERCLHVRDRMVKDGVYQGGQTPHHTMHWRISPEPFRLEKPDLSLIESLGPYLYSFYKASNRLYYESLNGRQPAWIAGYLNQGKPQSIVEYACMNRMKGLLPGVIRPDIILTEDGMTATELDSVPGGMGITGALGKAYSSLEEFHDVVGGRDGMVEGFLNMLRSAARKDDPVIAIVVSRESEDYGPEMEWLAGAMREHGGQASSIKPEDIIFTEEGLFLHQGDLRCRIDVLYRFFELFDLRNIPKTELIMYSAKKKEVAVTPPFKPFLEEKLLYALFHHPLLREYWLRELGDAAFSTLQDIFPATWILDPAELPPYGVIPGLTIGERPVTGWTDLAEATQTERDFVIKPSGFSEFAWGSRGVIIGNDVSKEEWGNSINKALMDFQKTPHILQQHHKGRHVEVDYLDETTGDVARMRGRVRLCPYYFVEGEDVKLRGIMATICPLDKKLVHGMADAVITVAGRGL